MPEVIQLREEIAAVSPLVQLLKNRSPRASSICGCELAEMREGICAGLSVQIGFSNGQRWALRSQLARDPALCQKNQSQRNHDKEGPAK
jgi:hypothetical protein